MAASQPLPENQDSPRLMLSPALPRMLRELLPSVGSLGHQLLVMERLCTPPPPPAMAPIPAAETPLPWQVASDPQNV